jgi:nucleoid-associated protein YgaU
LNNRRKKNSRKKATILLAVFFVVWFFIAFVVAHADNTKYESYTVQAGDTIWDIAAGRTPKGKDIRETVYNIREHNNISPLIYPGQVIQVPEVK